MKWSERAMRNQDFFKCDIKRTSIIRSCIGGFSFVGMSVVLANSLDKELLLQPGFESIKGDAASLEVAEIVAPLIATTETALTYVAVEIAKFMQPNIPCSMKINIVYFDHDLMAFNILDESVEDQGQNFVEAISISPSFGYTVADTDLSSSRMSAPQSNHEGASASSLVPNSMVAKIALLAAAGGIAFGFVNHSEHNQLQNRVYQLEKDQGDLNSDLESVELQLDAINSDLTIAENLLSAVNAGLTTLTSSHDALGTTVIDLDADLTIAEDLLGALEKDLTIAEDLLGALEKDLTIAERILAVYEKFIKIDSDLAEVSIIADLNLIAFPGARGGSDLTVNQIRFSEISDEPLEGGTVRIAEADYLLKLTASLNNNAPCTEIKTDDGENIYLKVDVEQVVQQKFNSDGVHLYSYFTAAVDAPTADELQTLGTCVYFISGTGPQQATPCPDWWQYDDFCELI